MISSLLSPTPTISDVFVMMSGLIFFACFKIRRDCSKDALGSLTFLSSLGTHSTLCAKTERGLFSRSNLRASKSPLNLNRVVQESDWLSFVNFVYTFTVMSSSTIRQIITINYCYYCMS